MAAWLAQVAGPQRLTRLNLLVAMESETHTLELGNALTMPLDLHLADAPHTCVVAHNSVELILPKGKIGFSLFQFVCYLCFIHKYKVN